MIHPHTKLAWIDETIGFGVVATQMIPKGTIVWILDDLDQRLDESYVQSLDRLRQGEVKKYSYRNQFGEYVLCWDLGRFVNHSSNPTCLPTAYDLEIAGRDILPGEELTDDYGTLNLEEPFPCSRGTEGGRRLIQPDDILRLYPTWDRQAAEAMRYMNQVEQPLGHLINEKHRRKVAAVAAGQEEMDSTLLCYYSANAQ